MGERRYAVGGEQRLAFEETVKFWRDCHNKMRIERDEARARARKLYTPYRLAISLAELVAACGDNPEHWEACREMIVAAAETNLAFRVSKDD
jgi:hypothetical protein